MDFPLSSGFLLPNVGAEIEDSEAGAFVYQNLLLSMVSLSRKSKSHIHANI